MTHTGALVVAAAVVTMPVAQAGAAGAAHGGKHAAAKVVSIPGANKRVPSPPTNRVGLGASAQLAQMDTAIAAAPAFFADRPTGCANVTPLLASQPGAIMAGNFRDADGNCYVWLNLQQSSLLTGPEICKTTLHEMGHLSGLQHSTDPADVMYAPFQADPIPAPCATRNGRS